MIVYSVHAGIINYAACVAHAILMKDATSCYQRPMLLHVTHMLTCIDAHSCIKWFVSSANCTTGSACSQMPFCMHLT